jgi:hypothetical protein
MSAEAADMPVKPRMPAMTEIKKKSSAHLRSVTVQSSSMRRNAQHCRINLGQRNRFLQRILLPFFVYGMPFASGTNAPMRSVCGGAVSSLEPQVAEGMSLNVMPSMISKQIVVSAVGLEGSNEKDSSTRCGKATC